MKLGAREEAVSLLALLQEGKRWKILVARPLWDFTRHSVLCAWPSSQSLGALGLHPYNRLLISLCALYTPFSCVSKYIWSY